MTSRVPALIVYGSAGADPAEGREELRDGVREIERDRAFSRAAVGETEVELTLETPGATTSRPSSAT